MSKNLYVTIGALNSASKMVSFNGDEIGYWNGALSDRPLGPALRNKIFSMLGQNRKVVTVQPALDIVHKSTDYDVSGRLSAFRPGTIDQGIARQGLTAEIAEYDSPGININPFFGQSTWTPVANPSFKSMPPVLTYDDQGQMLVIVGQLDIYVQEKDGKKKITAMLGASPFSTYYAYEKATPAGLKGFIEPYDYPSGDRKDSASTVTYSRGAGLDVDVVKIGDSIAGTKGIYAIEMSPQALEKYSEVKTMIIYAPVSAFKETASLTGGPFEINADKFKWEDNRGLLTRGILVFIIQES
jgi:hypothetical protein